MKIIVIIGPGASGIKTLLGGFAVLLPDLKFERQHTMLCGDRVTVLSKMSGTIPRKLPQGFEEIPFFSECNCNGLVYSFSYLNTSHSKP